ncbi:MAG: PAS domain S-box protein [Cytophagales bacterium]|nr:PAS domain S-box protein [Armatimonadota bacterium]
MTTAATSAASVVPASEPSFRDSEQGQFDSLFRNIPTGIYRTTPEGRILLANPALLRMLGYERFEEIASLNLEVDGGHSSYSRAHFRQRMEAEGEVRGLESVWWRRDGSAIHVRENAIIVRGQDGKTLYFEGTVEDVTEYRAAQNALSQSERMLRSFFDTSPLILGVVELVEDSCGGDILQIACSANIVSLTGLAPNQIEGRLTSTLGIPEATIQEWRLQCLRSRAGGKPVRQELVLGEGGQARRLFITLQHIAGPQFSYVIEDITERTRMQGELQERETTLRSLYESVPLMMGTVELTDPQKGEGEDIRHISDNAAAARSFGLEDPSQTKGKLASELGVSSETVRRWRTHYLKSAETGSPIRFEYVHAVLASGESTWFAVTVQQIHGSRFCYVAEDVSERRRSEHQLRLLQAAVENANDVILITEAEPVDAPGPRVLYVNPAFERMTGYPQREIRGSTPRLLQGPGTSAETRALIRRKLTAWEPISTEILNYRKDGTSFWVDLSIHPVADETGRYTHWVGIQRDSTQRRRAEEALKQSEEQYRLLFIASPHPMWVSDRENFRFLEVNDAAIAHYGYTREEFLTLRLTDIRPDSECAALEQNAKVYQTVTDYGGPWLHLKKDGTRIKVEVAAHPLTFRGRPARLTVIHDITEKLRAEESLRETQERLRTVVDNLPVVVFGLDTNGVFTFSEGKGLASLGLHPGEVTGRSALDVYRSVPEVAALIQDALVGKATSWLLEVQGIAFETKCKQMFDAEGRMTGVIGVAMDVTERSQLRQKILQSEKLATLGEMVAGIAHEMNNPLAAISGNAQLLAMHSDAQVREDAQSIRLMADRASRVVRSLLTFAHGSSAEKGVERGAHEVRSLHSLVAEALSLSEFGLSEAGVEISWDAAKADHFCVKVCTDQIVQVLLNLLGNAEHAMRSRPKGGRLLQIQMGADESLVWVYVGDSGTGMSEATRQRVFEPFFTTKDIGEGTGLGLSLCHGIVQAHDGTLTAQSAEGVGSVFTLCLPRHHDRGTSTE